MKFACLRACWERLISLCAQQPAMSIGLNPLFRPLPQVAPAGALPAVWRKDYVPQDLDMGQAWERLEDLAASKQAAAARAAEAAEVAWMESWGYEQVGGRELMFLSSA